MLEKLAEHGLTARQIVVTGPGESLRVDKIHDLPVMWADWGLLHPKTSAPYGWRVELIGAGMVYASAVVAQPSKKLVGWMYLPGVYNPSAHPWVLPW
jgi:hypothetical protein